MQTNYESEKEHRIPRLGTVFQFVDNPLLEEKGTFAAYINYNASWVQGMIEDCIRENKSFAQAFSKACEVQRQSLWSRSAEREIPPSLVPSPGR